MRTLRHRISEKRNVRRFVSACIAAAFVAGCGGAQISPSAERASFDAATKGSRTFHYTASEQRFKVPAGIYSVIISATGGHGAGHGGFPGRVRAKVPVHPGDVLYVYVGGEGSTPDGGFNGGGSGGSDAYCNQCGYGGGGASDVRRSGDDLSDRIVVAGGGGGQGFARMNGGWGGGPVGGAGRGRKAYGHGLNGGGGGGGTQYEGGAGGLPGSYLGVPGNPGSLATGGAGAGASYQKAGGGGGGGYYGGGGGGSGSIGSNGEGAGSGGGGGGGSSYVEPGGIAIHDWQGYDWFGNGIIVIQW